MIKRSDEKSLRERVSPPAPKAQKNPPGQSGAGRKSCSEIPGNTLHGLAVTNRQATAVHMLGHCRHSSAVQDKRDCRSSHGGQLAEAWIRSTAVISRLAVNEAVVTSRCSNSGLEAVLTGV